jgi:hypothetical protein
MLIKNKAMRNLKLFRNYTIIVVVMLLSKTTVFSQTSIEPQGFGTLSLPYLVSSIENLYWISQNPDKWDKYYIQINDIDAYDTQSWDGGKGWKPIASGGKFNGFYDGQRHTISGLYINRPNEDNVGLFSHVGHANSTSEQTEIRKLGLIDVNIVGGRGTGALIGRIIGNKNTLVEYCYVEGGNVSGNGSTGGLIGSHNSYQETAGGTNNPILQYSYASVNVSMNAGAAGTKDKFGGLVGCSQKGTIANSYALGSLYVEDAIRIGGLVGCIDYGGKVISSYAAVEIIDINSIKVGGFVGNTTGSGAKGGVVQKSFWDMEVSDMDTSAGDGGAIGKLTFEMKEESTFDEWLIGEVWGIDENMNLGYPYLILDQVPLSVTLLKFEATIFETHILINWETASEINNDYFTIQKTVDGVNFETVSVVTGAGNASTITRYETSDYNPFIGISYYRLVQTDFEGEVTYFPLLAVSFEAKSQETKVVVSPNPSYNKSFKVQIYDNPDSKVNVMVFDLSGNMIFSDIYYTAAQGQIQINSEEISRNFRAGTYILSVIGENTRQIEKIIIH